MNVGVFSCKGIEEKMFRDRNHHYGFDLEYLPFPIRPETLNIAQRYDAISVSSEDILDKSVLDTLCSYDIHHIALRCHGSCNLDLNYAKKLNISISRIPSYSSASVAEHSIALILSLGRKLYRSFPESIDMPFLKEEQLGFDLKNKTIGVIGTGSIGTAVLKILAGFGCNIVCHDISPCKTLIESGFDYLSPTELFKCSDIITLHCPLTADNHHMIDQNAIQNMKQNVMLINTCMAQLIHPHALISGLKSQKIEYLGIDIYDMDISTDRRFKDTQSYTADFYQRLCSFPNVIVTDHKGFYTRDSMVKIIETTLLNLQYCFAGKICPESFL